jgi:hypothetical protein
MTMPAKKLTVALGSDFLSAFARIPRGQQAKVLTFTGNYGVNVATGAFGY